MWCTNCGAFMNDAARFCRECGEATEPVDASVDTAATSRTENNAAPIFSSLRGAAQRESCWAEDKMLIILGIAFAAVLVGFVVAVNPSLRQNMGAAWNMIFSTKMPETKTTGFTRPVGPQPPAIPYVPDVAPEIVAQIGTELSIGDITAPPGDGGLGGSSCAPGVGASPGGPGDGVYTIGGGVTAPIAINQPLPLYTEEARKARVEGIVLLQAVIRRDGTVDSFKAVRGLGYGLDESAINTIATKWRFKPGTLSGRPVDVMANIEVTFRLY